MSYPGLKILGLALLCLFGALVYAIAGTALGAFRWGELRRAFRR